MVKSRRSSARIYSFKEMGISEIVPNKEIVLVKIYYSKLGKPNNDGLDDNNAAALTIQNLKKILYKIKTDKMGRLYDPRKDKLSESDGLSGNPKFKMRQVTKESFDVYINFLLKPNDSLLALAERSIR